ncbi:acetolactate synthase 2 catalytic subunit [Haemophilus influenzae]|uniref:Acetolactate synthase 2 catalytic subunit n=1 Tax=Haemophilus influenzae TaxID=727 RepID=A0A2X1PY32_HAEIF|nr:acetolactate synthase 2 catalytic subunit [Haemophilus influenzae]
MASNRKPNNAIICTDVGQHKMWSVQLLRVARHCGFYRYNNGNDTH